MDRSIRMHITSLLDLIVFSHREEKGASKKLAELKAMSLPHDFSKSFPATQMSLW